MILCSYSLLESTFFHTWRLRFCAQFENVLNDLKLKVKYEIYWFCQRVDFITSSLSNKIWFKLTFNVVYLISILRKYKLVIKKEKNECTRQYFYLSFKKILQLKLMFSGITRWKAFIFKIIFSLKIFNLNEYFS